MAFYIVAVTPLSLRQIYMTLLECVCMRVYEFYHTCRPSIVCVLGAVIDTTFLHVCVYAITSACTLTHSDVAPECMYACHCLLISFCLPFSKSNSSFSSLSPAIMWKRFALVMLYFECACTCCTLFNSYTNFKLGRVCTRVL